MAERPEDLNLPNAVVTRIIKDALPPGVNIAKDARLAISKAASVFVLYTTSCANNSALSAKRKTINVNDVFAAVEDMEFDTFLNPLKDELQAYKKMQTAKKTKKAAASKSKTSQAEGGVEESPSTEPVTKPEPSVDAETSSTPTEAPPVDKPTTNDNPMDTETTRLDTSS